MAGALQLLRQLAGLVLGAGEDQGRTAALLAQELQQQFGLEVLGHGVHGVGHGLHRSAVPDGHPDGITQDLFGQGPDAPGHGGREEQVLALGGQGGQDALEIRQEAHVEHAVGLVQNQGLQVAELHIALADVVQQTAGAGNHAVGALTQGPDLGSQAHATVDGGALEAGLAAQGRGRLVNLFRQFPGGGDDQDADPTRLDGRVHETLDQGQQKGRGLAGTGLGQTHDVAPFQNMGHGLGLNGSGGGIAHGLDVGRNDAVKIERCEIQNTILWLQV